MDPKMDRIPRTTCPRTSLGAPRTREPKAPPKMISISAGAAENSREKLPFSKK
jgi:hypothetical protein